MESGRVQDWLNSGTAAEKLINLASSIAVGQNEEDSASKSKEENDIWTSIICCIKGSRKLSKFMILTGAK